MYVQIIQLAMVLLYPCAVGVHITGTKDSLYPDDPYSKFLMGAKVQRQTKLQKSTGIDLEKGYFVTLADPQLGMSTTFGGFPGPYNIWREANMFGGLVDQIAKMEPPPQFVMVLGDMQNAWPKADAAKFQAQAERATVRGMLDPLYTKKIPIFYTPGNHDINDVPSLPDVENYQQHWEAAQQFIFGDQDVLVFTINSQIYQTAEQQGQQPTVNPDDTAKMQNDQATFMTEVLTGVTEKTKMVIIMTHIPPFMSTMEEQPGWANWDTDARTEVMNLIVAGFGKNRPKLLWVCGHFHTNVENPDVQYVPQNGGKPLDMSIIVTSSASTGMWWGDANCDGHLEPSQAMQVASIPVGGGEGAFVKYILGGGAFNPNDNGQCPTPCQNKEFDRYNTNLPRAERSGLTLFQFNADTGTMSYQWKTLEEFGWQGEGKCDRS